MKLLTTPDIGMPGLPGVFEIEFDFIIGADLVAQSRCSLDRVQFAGGDAVAEKDARKTFREDELAIRRPHRDGRVFARTAAAKVFAADYDGKFAVELAFFDVADGIKRFRQTIEGVAAELLVFLGNGGHEVEKLGGDDLVGVDVVAHDVNRAGENRLHSEDTVP